MRLPPLTLDAVSDPGEHLATANRAAPTGTPAEEQTANSDVWPVVPIDQSGNAVDQEPNGLWQVSARFTATGGNATAEIILWCWDVTAEVWYSIGALVLVITPTTQRGEIMEVPGRLGTSHVLFEISGLGDGDELGIILREKKDR